MGDDMSDPLARATRALRDKHEAASKDGDPATRDKILERAARDGRERKLGRVVLLPIAATFVLFATWAAATGRLPQFFPSQNTAPAETPPPLPALSLPVGPASASRPASASDAPPAREDAGPPPSASASPPAPSPPLQKTEPLASARGHRPAIAPSALPPRSTSEEDALYASAHAAHFEARDTARALAAWDAYLAKAPHGRFAPEASYNRALCLARLGRNEEARAALEPFASGAMGGYRKDEASSLIERLRD